MLTSSLRVLRHTVAPTRLVVTGLLFSSLWKRLFGFGEFKVCVIGLDNAGKTTVLFQLHLGEVVETQPTIGSNVESVVHKNIHFNVWDLGGQESLRSSWDTYFVGSHAVILVVDSADEKRLGIARAELWKALSNPLLANAAVLVFANKQDLKHKLSAAAIAQHLQLHAVRTHAWHIQSCSALTGDGLYLGMDWLTQKLTGANALPPAKPAPPQAAAPQAAAPAAAGSGPGPGAAAAGAAVDAKQPAAAPAAAAPAAAGAGAGASAASAAAKPKPTAGK